MITKESLLSYLKQDSFNLSTMHLSPTVELVFLWQMCVGFDPKVLEVVHLT